ncbi:MAG: TetR/AcrR family transcriptional regulator [Streptococcus sp.]|nr:TetR/AcrR family transcriptional regulator [Streptococcus sp.]
MAIDTRKRILDAYFTLALQHPEKTHFTFTEIAKQAGLSRQAIYKRHFNNTDEIIEYIHQEITNEFTSNHDSSSLKGKINPFSLFAQTIIPSMYQQREHLRILYQSSIDPLWKSFMIQNYQNWIEENISFSYQKLGLSKKMTNRILAVWLSSLIENWLTEEETLTPQEFSQIFLNLTSSPLMNFTIFNGQMNHPNKLTIHGNYNQKKEN